MRLRIAIMVAILAGVTFGTYGLTLIAPPFIAWLGGLALALAGLFAYEEWVLRWE